MKSRWIIAGAAALSLGILTLPLLRGGGGEAIKPRATGVAPAEQGSCDAQGFGTFDFVLKDQNNAPVNMPECKGKVVIVNFWATWCGPCKMIAPALDELAASYAGRAKVVKIDIDQNRTTVMKYHVRSIPTLLLFKDGQVQATQIGAVGKAQLAQMLDKAL